MKTLILIVGLFFSVNAFAAPKLIVACKGISERFPDLYIELYEDESGKISSSYTLGKLPLYYPTWTNAGKIGSPPKRFPRLLSEVNQFRPTGIDPADVKKFQGIFIDGSGSWAIELWKLMGADGKILGWMSYAYGTTSGCY